MNETNRQSGWRAALDLIATIVMIVAAAALTWAAIRGPGMSQAGADPRRQAPFVTDPIDLRDAVLEGSPQAPLVLLVFSDFECKFCARFSQETLPEIKRLYVLKSKLQLAFWNFPLPIHANAKAAAAAGECAASQGRFWELHDAFCRDIKKLSRQDIFDTARGVGLGLSAFESCVVSDSMNSSVERDSELGNQLGVKGTPAFFVGTRQPDGRVLLNDRIDGARPLTDFTAAFDKRLQ